MSYTVVVKDQEELNHLIAAQSAMESLAYFFESMENALFDVKESISEDSYSWKKVDAIMGKVRECMTLTEETILCLKESIEDFWDE